jgi:hypothetical protein
MEWLRSALFYSPTPSEEMLLRGGQQGKANANIPLKPKAA